MKVVFDTNILISGFLTSTGVSQSALTAGLKRHTVILSEFILEELRKKLVGKLGVPEKEVEVVTHFLRTRAVVLKISPNPKIQFGDKKDIPLLSLVEACAPHYLVTEDKKLVELKKHKQTLILTPREALEAL